jgi:hypothetical protein
MNVAKLLEIQTASKEIWYGRNVNTRLSLKEKPHCKNNGG